ncbi:hypothetical protein EET67_19545 [Pseudaminobacter arsenicus]|uniref:Carbonic anhydrase n=1 Tax=Borborobacter arsenicus TaxID=1851146 RepID=A0A432V235_9HYPH|nr:carbonic anhydrase [Pseudaminobacter arsenicus]RUM96185.1 hypothetical protein EET67_19545 [Pseudaminobacter arsenicus]
MRSISYHRPHPLAPALHYTACHGEPRFISFDFFQRGAPCLHDEVAGAKAVVVLGHNSCGSIKAAIDDVEVGNITAMLKNLKPALSVLDKSDGPRKSDNQFLVQKIAEENARQTAASLTDRSPIIRHLADAGKLTIAAAMHDLTSGRVSWLT